MGQFKPCLGERISELLWILEPALCDRAIDRVHPQSEIRREHNRGVPLLWIVGIRNRVGCGAVLGNPLVLTGRALAEFPLKAVEIFQKVVVPLYWVVSPRALQTAGERVGAFATAIGVSPSQALLFDWGRLRFAAYVAFRYRTMSFSEGMPADNQRSSLHVVHRHPAEGLPDIKSRSHWIGLSLRAFRIDVNQSHLNRAERMVPLTGFLVAGIGQPFILGTPVRLVFLPDILAPSAETKRLEAHRLQCDVAGQNHQVAPGEFAPVLLLYRPEQAARLVEARIVRPAAGWGKTLVGTACPAATVADAVRTRSVPRHTNEQRPVVPIIGGPPLLRVRHQGSEVLDHGVQVKGLEFSCVVKILVHRVGQVRVLVQDSQVQPVRPPLRIRRTRVSADVYRTLAFA